MIGSEPQNCPTAGYYNFQHSVSRAIALKKCNCFKRNQAEMETVKEPFDILFEKYVEKSQKKLLYLK